MTATESHARASGYDPPIIELPPLFQRPRRPLAWLRWNVGSFLWPQSLAWIAIAAVAWNFFTPSFSRMTDLRFDWIALIYIRNVVLMLVVVGGQHYWLHIRKSQKMRYKYDPRWLATNRKRFLFGHQTRDNMLWSLASGALIAALYESFVLWIYANEWVASITWSQSWVYVLAILFATFYIEGVHFYLNHRLLHTNRLYKWAHSLHHKNINTGPWSGIAMHPVEHLLYFSLPLVFLVIPASPMVVAFCGIYLMLSPSPSHSGFDRFELGGDRTFHGGDYFHNLHHRYFECNYGMLLLPIDKWAGTFHDGSPEAHKKIKQKKRQPHRRRRVRKETAQLQNL